MVAEVNGPNAGGVNALDQRGPKIGGTAASLGTTSSAGVKNAEVVTLTDLAARLRELTQLVVDLPVADREKVEAFRRSIAEGSYEVDAGAVAEKLVTVELLLADLSRSE